MQRTRDHHTIGIRVVQEAGISVERYRTEESTTPIHTSRSVHRLWHNEHGGVIGAWLVGTATVIFGIADAIAIALVIATPSLISAPAVGFIGVLTGITALGAFGTWRLSRQDDESSHKTGSSQYQENKIRSCLKKAIRAEGSRDREGVEKAVRRASVLIAKGARAEPGTLTEMFSKINSAKLAGEIYRALEPVDNPIIFDIRLKIAVRWLGDQSVIESMDKMGYAASTHKAILAAVRNKDIARHLYDGILASERDFEVPKQEELLNSPTNVHLDKLALAVVIAQKWLDGDAVDKASLMLIWKVQDFIDAQIALAGKLESMPSRELVTTPRHKEYRTVWKSEPRTGFAYEMELATYQASAQSWNHANLTGDALGPRPVRPQSYHTVPHQIEFWVEARTYYEETHVKERARSLRQNASAVQSNYMERFDFRQQDAHAARSNYMERFGLQESRQVNLEIANKLAEAKAILGTETLSTELTVVAYDLAKELSYYRRNSVGGPVVIGGSEEFRSVNLARWMLAQGDLKELETWANGSSRGWDDGNPTKNLDRLLVLRELAKIYNIDNEATRLISSALTTAATLLCGDLIKMGDNVPTTKLVQTSREVTVTVPEVGQVKHTEWVSEKQGYVLEQPTPGEIAYGVTRPPHFKSWNQKAPHTVTETVPTGRTIPKVRQVVELQRVNRDTIEVERERERWWRQALEVSKRYGLDLSDTMRLEGVSEIIALEKKVADLNKRIKGNNLRNEA